MAQPGRVDSVSRVLAEHKRTRSAIVNRRALEASDGSPLDLNNLSGRTTKGKLDSGTIKARLSAAGLEWKGHYGGRRGAETEINRFTNGKSHTTSHHFGHSKEVADAQHIQPLPEETRNAALAMDNALAEAIERQQETRIV